MHAPATYSVHCKRHCSHAFHNHCSGILHRHCTDARYPHIAAATDSVHHHYTVHRSLTTIVRACSTFTVQTSVIFSVHVAAATYNAHRTFPLSIVWTVSAFTVKRPPSSLLTQLLLFTMFTATFTVYILHDRCPDILHLHCSCSYVHNVRHPSMRSS